MSKKIIALLLSVMLLVALTVVASATETPAEHKHCVCGGAPMGEDANHTCEEITWQPLPEGTVNFGSLAAGNYYLTGDVEITGATTHKDLNICLNGHNITTTTGRVFASSKAVTLTMTDCSYADGQWDGTVYGGTSVYGGILYTHSKEVVNIYGGNYTSNFTDKNVLGGLFVIAQDKSDDLDGDGKGDTSNPELGGVMNLYNGNIFGGTAGRGGNVYMMHASTFNMYGGVITEGEANGNSDSNFAASGWGGNLCADAATTLNIYGGEISNGYASHNTVYDTSASKWTNSTNGRGGNIYTSGTINLYGGDIFGGRVNGLGGGNIFATGARTFTMSGGRIWGGIANADNDAAKSAGLANAYEVCGGSLRFESGAKFNMTGGTIGIDANGKPAGGTTLPTGTECGNIYFYTSTCVANLSGGTIAYGNTWWDYEKNELVKGTTSKGGNIGGTAKITVSGEMVIRDGYAVNYGGNWTLFNTSNSKMTGGTISGGTASSGGNICHDGSVSSSQTFTISGGTITGGTATSSGGNIRVGADEKLIITGGTISNGTATNGGGNIHVTASGKIEASNATLLNGTAKYGGSVYCYGASGKVIKASFTDCTFTGGQASGAGGGNLFLETNVEATITGCTFADGKAIRKCTASSIGSAKGGNVYVSGSAAVIEMEDCSFTGGEAFVTNPTETYVNSKEETVQFKQAGHGGNMVCVGTLTMTNCTFEGGAAHSGGNLYLNGTTTLTDCAFEGGSAQLAYGTSEGNGGNLYYSGGKTTKLLTMTRCELIDGVTNERGGNFAIFGKVNATDCTFTGGSAKNGGNLFAYGENAELTIDSCDITGGTATSSGGNISFSDVAGNAHTIKNSVVTGGAAEKDGNDIYCGPSQLTLEGAVELNSIYVQNTTPALDLTGFTPVEGAKIELNKLHPTTFATVSEDLSETFEYAGGTVVYKAGTADDGTVEAPVEGEEGSVDAPVEDGEGELYLIMDIDIQAISLSLSAGDVARYNVSYVVDTILTVQGADAYVIYNGTTYGANEEGIIEIAMGDEETAYIEIGNAGTKQETFDVEFIPVVGSYTYPVVINEAGQLAAIDVKAQGTTYVAVSSMLNNNLVNIVAADGVTVTFNGTEQTAAEGLYTFELNAAGPMNQIIVTNTTDADVSLIAEIKGAVGSESNPIVIDEAAELNGIEIEAGASVYYAINAQLNTNILTIVEVEGMTVSLNGTELTAKGGLFTAELTGAPVNRLVVTAGDKAVNTPAFIEPAPGTENNPIVINQAYDLTGVEAKAGTSTYYVINAQLNGMVLTVADVEGLTVNLNGTELTAKGGLFTAELTGTPANRLIITAGETDVATPAAIEDPIGTENNPIVINQAFDMTGVEAKAGTSTYYAISSQLNGLYLVITDTEGMTVTFNGEVLETYDAVYSIELNGAKMNQLIITAGETDVATPAVIEAKKGSESNPFQIITQDDTASDVIAAGDSMYVAISNMVNGNDLVVYADANAQVMLNGVALEGAEDVFTGTLNAARVNQLIITNNGEEEAFYYVTVQTPAGSESNPIMLEEAETEITVPAGKTMYYTGRFGGLTMVAAGEGLTIEHNGQTYTMTAEGVSFTCVQADFYNPCVFAVTNAGETDLTGKLTVVYPEGSWENPAELVLGETTCENSGSAYFYNWTAAEDGKFTFTIDASCTDWTYVINNETAGTYGDNQSSATEDWFGEPLTPVYSTTVDVAAGDLLQIVIGTNSGDAATVKFTTSFEGKAPAIQPQATISLAGRNLRLQDLLKVGFYFTASSTQKIEEVGALMWTDKQYAQETDFTVESTLAKKFENMEGQGGYYIIESDGIFVQEMDTVYYVSLYVKTEHGYVYGDVASFSALMYASSVLAHNEAAWAETKSLVVDLLNYATAARTYFAAEGTMEPAALPFNSILTEEQKVVTFEDGMTRTMNTTPVKTGTFNAPRYASNANLQEAINVGTYFLSNDVAGGYYWTEAAYKAAETLTAANASGTTAHEMYAGGYAKESITGIFAYNIYDVYYMAGANAEGELSDVYEISVAGYLSRLLEVTDASASAQNAALVNLLKAMLVYGDNATTNGAISRG